MTLSWRHPNVKCCCRHASWTVSWALKNILALANSKLHPSFHPVCTMYSQNWDNFIASTSMYCLSISRISPESFLWQCRCHIKLNWWWIEPFSMPNILCGSYLGFMLLVMVFECCEAGFQLRQALRSKQQEKEERRRARLKTQARRFRPQEEPLLEETNSCSDSRKPEVRLMLTKGYDNCTSQGVAWPWSIISCLFLDLFALNTLLWTRLWSTASDLTKSGKQRSIDISISIISISIDLQIALQHQLQTVKSGQNDLVSIISSVLSHKTLFSELNQFLHSTTRRLSSLGLTSCNCKAQYLDRSKEI